MGWLAFGDIPDGWTSRATIGWASGLYTWHHDRWTQAASAATP
jgi:hypothetical protein